LVKKTYYPTSSDSIKSTDSTVYILRTFETDKVQKLSLPVYILRGRDTLTLYTSTDSVLLHELVHEVSEPLVFQQNTELAYVKERLNYPYFLIGVATVLVLLVLVWLVFGRALKIRYRIYKLTKDYKSFSTKFNTHVTRYNRSGAVNNLENAVSLWKNYLTRLERKPINSFTTKELVAFYDNNEAINVAMRQCDRAIYGNISSIQPEEMNAALDSLKDFATSRYQTIREETRHV
ncbi:MAG: hypothetical protein LPK19_17425, partial [Hymenobacteraceae bacterium]|nr:hypothetical protein [Hymenobacteraceae bacterium]MDX5398037.1 hypothetical protein [Hymenobacteraceae bacterium]MDX5514108.1 hypothetical protein [Hymenobacteraceae bacterium]